MGIYRKAKRAVVSKAKKRYYNKNKGKMKMNTLIRDGIKAYNMLNAEKKSITLGITSVTLGQVNVNSTGAGQYDITPVPPQDATASGRNGNSIKLCSSLLQVQLQGMSLTTSKHTLYLDIFKVNGTPVAPFVVGATTIPATEIYNPGIFSSVIDGTSTRYQNNFSDYTLVKSMKIVLPAEQLANEVSNKTLKIPLRYNRGKGHHIRYDGTSGTTSDIANGQLVMILRVDVGNLNTVTPSSLNVPITATSTGVIFRWGIQHWYYDN